MRSDVVRERRRDETREKALEAGLAGKRLGAGGGIVASVLNEPKPRDAKLASRI